MRRRLSPAIVLFAAALSASAALADPIALVPGTLNMFRDTRAANDVGVAQGDRIQFGADIVGGSATTSMSATSATGFTTAIGPCGPVAVNPRQCARTTAYDLARLDPWTFTFYNGNNTLTVLGPSLQGSQQVVPFPVSVTLSGTGLTPTVSWQLPGNFIADGFRINIYDKGQVLPTGTADIIHSITLANPASTSYTLPSILSTGQTLSTSGNYAIAFQVIETRGHVPATGNNALILARSQSYFDFSPLSGDVGHDVVLPTIVDGVYHFNVQGVGPEEVTYIDPFVTTAFLYRTGDGDPNFLSVLLPDVGDGQYILDYSKDGVVYAVPLGHDTQYFFGDGGVGAFGVRGIEASAGLDPNNPTAFVTGLTFASAGNFTGTMTPFTTFVAAPVPEPETIALLLAGLGLLAAARRRAAARPRP